MPDVWRSLSAIVFAILCASATVVMPMLVGVTIDSFGFSAAEAGRVASIELLGVGAGSLMIAALVGGQAPRTLGHVVVMCLLVGNGATMIAEGPVLYPCRFIAGLGEGGGIALMSAILASGRTPDRYFGLFFCVYLLFATVLFTLAGAVAKALGPQGVYVLFLIFCVPAAILAWATFPDRSTGPSSAAAGLPAAEPIDWPKVSLGLASMFLFFVGAGSVWVYMERIGLSAGLNAAEARQVLGAATLAGAAGAGLAATVGLKLGRLFPPMAGVTLMILALLAIGPFRAPEMFRPAAMAFVFGWMLAVPYLMGLMATLDPRGRAVSLSVGLQNGGQSLGPALASVVVIGAALGDVAIIAIPALAMSLAIYTCILLRLPSATSSPLG